MTKLQALQAAKRLFGKRDLAAAVRIVPKTHRRQIGIRVETPAYHFVQWHLLGKAKKFARLSSAHNRRGYWALALYAVIGDGENWAEAWQAALMNWLAEGQPPGHVRINGRQFRRWQRP